MPTIEWWLKSRCRKVNAISSLWSNSEQDGSFTSSFAIEEMQMNQRIESGLSKDLTLARCIGGHLLRRRAVGNLLRPVLPGVYRLSVGILLTLSGLSGGQAQAQQTPAFTLKIVDNSGLNKDANTKNLNYNFYYLNNHGNFTSWQTIPFGTSTFTDSSIPTGVGSIPSNPGGIAQIVLAPANPTLTSTNTSSTAVIGPSYSQLIEYSTVVKKSDPQNSKYTFDISQVNNFSIPVSATSNQSSSPLPPLGVPVAPPLGKQITRADVFTQYSSFLGSDPLGYSNLIVANLNPLANIYAPGLASPFSLPWAGSNAPASQAQQLILNPGKATAVGGSINLTGNVIAADVKDSPINQAWDDLVQKVNKVGPVQLVVPAYKSVGTGNSATEVSYFSQQYDSQLNPTGLASILFGSSSVPHNYDNSTAVTADRLYYNAGSSRPGNGQVYGGLQFYAKNLAGAGNAGASADVTAYVPSPDEISVQLLYKMGKPYAVIKPSTKYSATMLVSANDAGKIDKGMFLVSANGAFQSIGNSRSDVFISDISTVPNSNGDVKLTLASPGGNLIINAPSNSNNSAVIFGNVNDANLATGTQQNWFGNTWPLNALASPDNDVYCLGGPTDACDLSGWVGKIKTQINQAANWGTLNPAQLANGDILNNTWADANKWYQATDKEGGNPAYNLYSAFWHTQGVATAFPSNAINGFGAAYGFSVDENPFTDFDPAAFTKVQVPSKWDGTVEPGSTITITLLPWGAPPPPQICGPEVVCWSAGNGNFSESTNWYNNFSPVSSSPYSLISFQAPYVQSSPPISVTNDIPRLSVQGIEYLQGAPSVTLSGKEITIEGNNGVAISNASNTLQLISTPLSLPSQLAIHATQDSPLTLTGQLTAPKGWRKTGAGTLTLDGLTKGSPGQGLIGLAGGDLVIKNGTDLSNFSGISSSLDTSISGNGVLPGVPTGRSIRGSILPGHDDSLVGTLAFNGNLSLGPGSGVALNNLYVEGASDLIKINGDLSISDRKTNIQLGQVVGASPDDSYAIPLLLLTGPSGQVTGEFTKSIGVSDSQAITYSSTGSRRGVFLTKSGSGPGPTPTPGDCIQKGDPTSTTNPYSTAICGGRLKVDSSTSTTNWTLDNRGDNRIDQNGFASPITFSGAFSGAGNLFFENSGLNTGQFISLAGASSYTGPTFVGLPGGGNPVTLAVNGSIGSSASLTVFPGSTIQGTGFLPATILNPGATIAPGNSIGTLTAASLNLGGGTINAEIQGPQNDRINVTGNVTNFTGTANLIPFGGGSPYPGFIYTIISAPNSVDFATANSLTLVAPQLTSALLNTGTTLVQNPQGDPKSFAVQWKPINSTGAVTSSMQALGNGGANASCTAGSLDRAFNSLATQAGGNANNSGSLIGTTGFTTGQVAAAGMSTGFFDALNNLVQLPSTSQLVAAVNSLSPQPYAAFQSVGLDTLKQQREAVLSQAGQCLSNGWIINGSKAKKPLCAFGLAQNDTSSIRGTSDLSSYNSGVFSGGIGLEYYPSRQWSFGGSYSYGTSYANNFASSGATVTAGVNSINLFANFAASDQWRVRGLLGYSNFNINGSRSIAFIGNGSSLTANPNANGFTAALETDYAIPLTKPSAQTQAFLKPLLGIAWGGYQQSGFSESGGPLSLSVNANTANSFVTTAGLELSTSPIPLNKEKSISIRPNLLLAYQVDALANNASSKSLNSTFTEAASVCSTCSTQGQNLGTSALNLAGGLDLQVSQSTSFYVNASYRASSNASQFGYGGGIRVRF